jgi:uncharacterized protein (DUF305 family)
MNTNHHAKMNHGQPYSRLAFMALLSFLAMYALMYAMVDVFGNVYHNLNQVYMAGLMAAPMVVLELLLMGSMYPNKKANVALIFVSLILGGVFFGAIRQQSGITDAQFLRSMIPHHAGAILMCREAPITDPEVRELCRSIIAGQQAEIDQMKAMLGGM